MEEITKISETKETPKAEAEIKGEKNPEEKEEVDNNLVTIDDFDKLDLRVAEVIKAEKHPNADKLLVFQLKVGDETRQVVSGIAKYYKPEELVGKKVVMVYNLKPVTLRGIESKGMLLTAEKGKRLTMLSTLEDIESGATVS
jgi:methionyl-tRNA synthetase